MIGAPCPATLFTGQLLRHGPVTARDRAVTARQAENCERKAQGS